MKIRPITFNKASKFNALSGLILATLLLSGPAGAGCSRDDVSFYLNKGFSPAQIVNLCASTNPTAVPRQSADPLPPSANRPSTSALSTPTTTSAVDNETLLFLKTAIKGYDVNIDNGTLSYTTNICIEYGLFRDHGFTDEACPDVRFNIALNSLKIGERKSGIPFFSKSKLTLVGQIDRKILNIERYKARARPRIQQFLEKGNETLLPLRSDIPASQVEFHLNKAIQSHS